MKPTKLLLYLPLILMLALAIVAMGNAHSEAEKPECPEGYITIEEAQCTNQETKYTPDEDDQCPAGYEYCEDCNGWEDGCKKTICTQWSDPICEPEQQGEQCGRCSNKGPFWVEWYDRDGGCDDDYNNERVEFPPEDGVCGAVFGCTDDSAWNFDPEANVDDNSCVYDVCPNLEGLQETVPEGYVKPGRRCLPAPQNLAPVDVQVTGACGPADGEGTVHQMYVKIGIDPEGKATVSFGGEQYSESVTLYAPFGSHQWSAEAENGYFIAGANSGSVKRQAKDCRDDDGPSDGAGGHGMAPLIAWAATGLGALALGTGSYMIWRRRR